MIFILYDMLLLLALPVVALMVATRSLRGKARRGGVLERLGLLSLQKRKFFSSHRTIWVHAVSVGETMAARHLLRGLRSRFPHHSILLSTVTETGQGLATTFDEVDESIYLPYDLSLITGRVFDTVRPDCLVIMETELWPNLVRSAHRRNIPVVLANGRISDRSFPRYRKLAWFWRQVLVNFSALCMQSGEDACRAVAIGARAAGVHDAGNLKYDMLPRLMDEGERQRQRAVFALPPGPCPVLLAASTHAGEEEMILEAWSELGRQGEIFAPVLVPRHPERAAQVAESARSAGWKVRLRSSLTATSQPLASDELLLVDTIGELGLLYGIASIAFVGGSLVPVGGHNILEPLAGGAVTIFGPFMHNFRDISNLVLEAQAGLQVQDAKDLRPLMARLLKDTNERCRLADNGIDLLQRTGGAVERHLQVIARFVDDGV